MNKHERAVGHIANAAHHHRFLAKDLSKNQEWHRAEEGALTYAMVALMAYPKLVEALRPFADHGRVLREAGCEPSDQWCEVEGGRWTHWLAVQHFIDAADALQAILDAKADPDA